MESTDSSGRNIGCSSKSASFVGAHNIMHVVMLIPLKGSMDRWGSNKAGRVAELGHI